MFIDRAVSIIIIFRHMNKILFLTFILSISIIANEKVNLIIGTQTFGVKYKFTEDTSLVETAKQIYNMGSDTLKFIMGKDTMVNQYFDIPYDNNINSLTKLASNEPSVKAVLNMPFKNYIIWIYPFAPGANSFIDGYSDTEATNAYREIYNFCKYILNTYNNSGKTFYLGHWEGDWYLHPNYDPNAIPSNTAISGMVKWLNCRQKAIDDAKNNLTYTNVQIYNYAEVNLVQKGMEGKKCMINDVIPNVNIDFISYSSYDTTSYHKNLFNALDYIESKIQPKSGIQGKRVFIGEYGFPLKTTNSQQLQNTFSKNVCIDAVQWGVPFVLYWQMYCNETNSMGEHLGYWLIDDQNKKQVVYYTFKNYFSAMKAFVNEFKETNNRMPTDAETRTNALFILSGDTTNVFTTSDELNSLPIKPMSDDLTQSQDVNIYVKGNTNQYFNFNALFNSDFYGSYGESSCIFPDGISPENDVILQFDFLSVVKIDEIHIFSLWGDARLFTWFDVWVSVSGTNDNDYTKLGTISFGKINDFANSYTGKHCVAKLYNTSNFLATDVKSLKLIQKNSGYYDSAGNGIKEMPATPLGDDYNAAVGAAVMEVDIIGNIIPEPTCFFFFLLQCLTVLLRR